MGVERVTKGLRLGEVLRDWKNYYADEPNTIRATPLTRAEMLTREEAMMGPGGTTVRDRVIKGERYVNSLASGDNRYGQFAFKWDSGAAIVIDASSGRVDQAAAHALTLERSRDRQTGFLPVKFPMEGVDYADAWPESTTLMREGRGSYSQPSLTSWSAMRVYEAYQKAERHEEARDFLRAMYGTAEEGNYTGMRGECEYFLNHRQTAPDNPLVFNTDPNETGRDYDKALKGPNRYLLPGDSKKVHFLNDTASWIQMHMLHRRKVAKLGIDREAEEQGIPREERRSDWIPEQVRKKYAVNDVMFNAMHVMNLRYTAKAGLELATLFPDEAEQFTQDAMRYEAIADNVEKAILTQMWHKQQTGRRDKQETFFYNKDARKDKQIPVKSITGLFPLLLDSIQGEQLDTLLDRLEDPDWFGTPYPIPSHPKNSEYYDPHYKRREGPDWQGPVWGITNHFLVEEGLVKQAERFLSSDSQDHKEIGKRCLRIADNIVKKSEELLAINDEIREHYDPETGQGQRVSEFMWSNLMLHFDKYQAAKEKYALAA